jgi:hypothetical protein
MFVVSFFLGFAFAFYYGWLLTCIALGGVPAMLIAGAGLAFSMERGFKA